MRLVLSSVATSLKSQLRMFTYPLAPVVKSRNVTDLVIVKQQHAATDRLSG